LSAHSSVGMAPTTLEECSVCGEALSASHRAAKATVCPKCRQKRKRKRDDDKQREFSAHFVREYSLCAECNGAGDDEFTLGRNIRFCHCEEGRRKDKLEACLRDDEEEGLGAPSGSPRGRLREKRIWGQRKADALGDSLKGADAMSFFAAEGGEREENNDPFRFRLQKSDVGVRWLPHEQHVSAAIVGVAAKLARSSGHRLKDAAHNRMDEMLLLLLTQVVQESLDKHIVEDLLHLA